MKQAEIIQALIKDHSFTEEDLKDLTYPELRAKLKKCETDSDAETDDSDKPETGKQKPKAKKYYPKDKFFGQVIQDTDRKNLKVVETEVDYRIIKFKHGTIKFVKGQEVTKTELALMSDYQKEFYLNAK